MSRAGGSRPRSLGMPTDGVVWKKMAEFLVIEGLVYVLALNWFREVLRMQSSFGEAERFSLS
jgi:hypothetical protein